MSVSFFASREDLAELLHALYEVPSLTAMQVYSVPGFPLVRCPSAPEAQQLLASGEDLICLHVANVMPEPSVRTINLNNGQVRLTVEGCGLFWLSVGFESSLLVCASTLSWFTEAGARAKCLAVPGPDAVQWQEHKAAASKFTYLLRRRLKVASSPGRPIMRAALEKYRQGSQLKEHKNATHAITATLHRPE